MPQRNGTVHTLTIDHKAGTDTRVFLTEEGARAALANWAREWWTREFGHLGRFTQIEVDAMPDAEITWQYFDRMEERMGDGETYAINETRLED